MSADGKKRVKKVAKKKPMKVTNGTAKKTPFKPKPKKKTRKA